MTFNEYLIETHGQNWQGVHMDLVDEGLGEDELNDKHNELIEEYEQHCEDNDIEQTIE